MPLPRNKKQQANRTRARKERQLQAHEIPHAADFEPDWVKDEPQRMSVFACGGNFVIPLHTVGSMEAADRYRRELQAANPLFNKFDFHYQTRGTLVRVPIDIVGEDSDVPIEVHPDNHELRKMYDNYIEEQRVEARQLYDRALRASKTSKEGVNAQLPQDDGTLKTVMLKGGKEVDPEEKVEPEEKK